jgi:HEAT repeat protein
MVIAGWALAVAPVMLRAQPAGPGNGEPVVVLLDRGPEITRNARLEAARRLAQRNSPEDRAALVKALQEVSNQTIQSVAAVAISELPDPSEEFINPLFTLLQAQVPYDLARSASRALGKYKTSAVVLQRLIDRTQAVTGEASRRAAIEALGAFPEKRAAARLMELLASPDVSTDLRNSSVRGLTEMTGASEIGADIGRWENWWRANQSLADDAFRGAIQTSKANRFEDYRDRYDRLAMASRAQISRFYRKLPPEQREASLLELLNSAEPLERAVAAGIVREDKASAAVIPESVQKQLTAMIGDLEPDVRLAVASALGALNYAPAIEPLLRQISIEPNPDVKSALARAIRPMQDLRAVDPLVNLLQDSDRTVARDAAIALRDLGNLIREKNDAPMQSKVAAALQQVIARTQADVAGDALREAAVDAMVPLQHQSLKRDLVLLVGSRESEGVRRNAIRALAQFGEEDLADSIAQALEDRSSPAVRLAAATALGRLGRSADIPALVKRLRDADPSVVTAAWNAIAATIVRDSTPAAQLRALAQNEFNENSDDITRSRRLAVLSALEAKFDPNDAKNFGSLAEVQQDIGRTHLAYKPPQAAEAIAPLASSLRYYKVTGSSAGEETLTELVMRAHLRAEKYADAIAFATLAIAQKPGNAETIGREIKVETTRLFDEKEYAKAETLISAAEEMTPPLADSTRKSLIDVMTDINRIKQNATRDGTTAPSGPRGTKQPQLDGYPIAMLLH